MLPVGANAALLQLSSAPAAGWAAAAAPLPPGPPPLPRRREVVVLPLAPPAAGSYWEPPVGGVPPARWGMNRSKSERFAKGYSRVFISTPSAVSEKRGAPQVPASAGG